MGFVASWRPWWLGLGSGCNRGHDALVAHSSGTMFFAFFRYDFKVGYKATTSNTGTRKVNSLLLHFFTPAKIGSLNF